MNRPILIQTYRLKFRNIIGEYFEQQPESAGLFAARCALRVLPYCIDSQGLPGFSRTPEMHLLNVLRSTLFAWLWESVNFPKNLYVDRVAGAGEKAVDEAEIFARAATEAAFAAARAAAISYLAGGSASRAAERAASGIHSNSVIYIREMQNDLHSLRSDHDIRFQPLFSFDVDRFFHVDTSEQYFCQAIQSIYGPKIADYYFCIVQGGDAAKALFEKSEQVFEDFEKIWEQLNEGTFVIDYDRDALLVELLGEKRDIYIPEDKSSYVEPNSASNEFHIPSPCYHPEKISDLDHLNREPLAKSVMTWLMEKSNKTNINLGLFGEWGAGKSTFINMLKMTDLSRRSWENSYEDLWKSRFENLQNYISDFFYKSKKTQGGERPKEVDYNTGTHLIWGEFNAWRYEHSGNIQAGFAQETVKALKSELGWFGKLQLTISFALRTHPWELLFYLTSLIVTLVAFAYGVSLKNTELTTAVLSVGVPAQLFFLFYLFRQTQKVLSHPLADKLNTYLRLPDFGEHLGTIPVMGDQIRLLTRLRLDMRSLIRTDAPWWMLGWRYKKTTTNQRLVFVVDDLDRCSPDGVVKTLEAVRLVMELDNVVVIVAIDQRVALASLAKHYEKLEKHHLLEAHDIARDYLAKVIHIPLVLEQPSTGDVENFLHEHLWNSSSENDKVEELTAKKNTDEIEAGNDKEGKAKEQLTQVKPNEESNISINSDVDESVTNVESHGELESMDLADSSSRKASSKTFEKDAEVNEKTAPLKQITGLSRSQRKIFLELVTRFNLSNPRQLKRLDNCYNLIRLRYSKQCAGKDYPEQQDEDLAKNYYRLYILVWLEYLHDQPTDIRCRFLKAWEQGDEFSVDVIGENKRFSQTLDRWELIDTKVPKNIQLSTYREVRGFILPAVNKTVPALNAKKAPSENVNDAELGK